MRFAQSKLLYASVTGSFIQPLSEFMEELR
jgi:hypothetical protein